MKRLHFNIALCILTSLPCQALAQDGLTTINNMPEPLNFKAIYSFGFEGLPIGKMGIEATQTPKHYAVTSDITTTGLMKIFVKHSSHTTAEGTSRAEGQYESHYQTKGKKKYVKTVTHEGVTGGEILIPPDPPTRQPVAAEMKRNVADPLTLILRMREELAKALRTSPSFLEGEGRGGGTFTTSAKESVPHPNPPPQGGREFSINLYDGRRLTQVNFTVGEKQILRYQDRRIPVIEVSVGRKLLAGFTQSELADHNPNEPQARLYITDDVRLIPIRAEFTMLFGTASATLVKECAGGESCLLGIKE